jgi:RNA polymerase primary sigma factor
MAARDSGAPASDTCGRRAIRARKLLRAARRGDRGARERLLVTQLGVIRSLAWRYRDLGLPFDDLVQEGALAFVEAIDRYDPSRGAEFDAYARFRVRRALRNALTEQALPIRLPKRLVEGRRAVERAEAELRARGGLAPTPAGLAAATGLSVEAVLEARGTPSVPLSLDDPRAAAAALAGAVADPAAPDPELEAVAHEQLERLRAALAQLPERQRRIVRRRWGIDGEPASTAALAAELELSARRTQTISEDALHRLRTALEPRDTTGTRAQCAHPGFPAAASGQPPMQSAPVGPKLASTPNQGGAR